jgi:hypothetical protein
MPDARCTCALLLVPTLDHRVRHQSAPYPKVRTPSHILAALQERLRRVRRLHRLDAHLQGRKAPQFDKPRRARGAQVPHRPIKTGARACARTRSHEHCALPAKGSHGPTIRQATARTRCTGAAPPDSNRCSCVRTTISRVERLPSRADRRRARAPWSSREIGRSLPISRKST